MIFKKNKLLKVSLKLILKKMQKKERRFQYINTVTFETMSKKIFILYL